MTTPGTHPAARLEDRLNALVAAWFRRRGWVPRVEAYTGYGAAGWVRVMARAVLAPPGTHASEVSGRDLASGRRAVRGWRSFLTAKVPLATVEVRIGDAVHQVRADRGGYVDSVLPADLPSGWQRVTLAVGGEPVAAPVLVVPPGPGVAMVSDIDDTVMVTALPRPLLAAWNSLVLHEHARRSVPGMAELYRR
jgi:phosphatidate phosphatase APP1